MNQIEAMKQALEALEDARLHIFLGDKNGVEANIRAHKQCESLRQAIAEAEKQEPVAMVVAYQYEDGSHAGHRLEWRGRNEANDFPEGTSFYTHPQPKTQAERAAWVGLTDDEILKLMEMKADGTYPYVFDIVKEAEAKLKEKNA